MKKGFTLLELIVVIIIIGILATLGLTQYTSVVEKGRSAEARGILGEIRTVEIAYNQENGAWGAITALPVSVPTACASTHYFYYSASSNTATAFRCTTAGKNPNGSTASTISINFDAGTWGGTAGYY